MSISVSVSATLLNNVKLLVGTGCKAGTTAEPAAKNRVVQIARVRYDKFSVSMHWGGVRQLETAA